MALHLPFPSAETPALLHLRSSPKPPTRPQLPPADTARPSSQVLRLRRHLSPRLVVSVGKEETELRVSSGAEQQDASPEDLECVQQIQRVLELLTKNRDMLFGEIRLTIMIEDPRDTERKRLLGIEDPDGVTRDDLVAALDDVNEGRIPENRVALRLLAKEIMEWPDLEVEAPKKRSPSKSPYAKATDTGVDPEVAAKRLDIDWDSAADVEPGDENDEIEVPPAVGYSALYLVTALPLLIGLSVVLILFYNSLQ
ncbi:protein CHLOROPLAST ENHANCING STRESS TOLERANCE, chloroplastic isoform X1 [Elaeis guineensis]|uniref:Protein CHLOROPLAST ENHANCING STRESS TOLERANCE, chloroplastic n=1 Tax=Elaeis guineensis var. tenera TaxID=51953 RepID=A0A6I9QGW3_ELAGV|nr:protein CHLOROPLAST ENHANCING STRESS TOLERANCE, chloroplastic [Elaeis guineensis]XP_029118179.1 protein CHLOROPLAST ENHANCING STRESS TOLERANCE, chloroplastic-like [Elaeis guineensis]